MTRSLARFATVLVLAACCGIGNAAERPTLPPGLNAPPKPLMMPAFELPTTDSNTLRSESLRGQVVIIRYWASWWSICLGEMPSVQRAHNELRASGVTVLAISIDGTGAKAAKPVMDEGKYSFSAPIDQDMGVARIFGVRGVPMTYVIDRSGQIVAQGFGPMNFDAPAFRSFVKAVAARGS